ncbi:hypothetical protein BGW41_000114 [Actinomortierella wolfii]|nr:hypothetical protein BGW41_000114 [Actinomortierella wolfii]
MMKPCETNGLPPCIKGFVREKCRKCNMGSLQCDVCLSSRYRHHHQQPTQAPASPRSSLFVDGKHLVTATATSKNNRHHSTGRAHSSPALMDANSSSSPSPQNSNTMNPTTTPASTPSCIFCFDGHKPCDECFGLGYVQRVCQDCLKDQHRRSQGKRRSTGSSYIYGANYQHLQQHTGHTRQLSRDSIPSTMPSILTSQQWKRWLGFGSSSTGVNSISASSSSSSTVTWRPSRQQSKSCSALDLEQQQQQPQHPQQQQQIKSSQTKDKPSRRHSSMSSTSSTMSLSVSTSTSASACPPPARGVPSQELRHSVDLARLEDDDDDASPPSLSQHDPQQYQQMAHRTKAWKRWMSNLKIKSRPALFKSRSHPLAAPVMSAA